MSVLEPLYAHDPRRPAVAIGETVIDYGRLCADIDTMAAWLAGQGFAAGDRIAVYPRSPVNPNYWDWIMLLGATRAGLVHTVGLLPPEVAQSGAAGPLGAVIGHPDEVARCPVDSPKLPFQPQGEGPLAEQIEVSGALPPVEAAARAVRLFKTSGTTGTPKVVPWDDPIMSRRLAEVRGTSGIGPDTRLLNFLGFITTTSLRHSLGGWQIGCRVLLTSIGDRAVGPRQVLIACDHLVASPFRLNKLLSVSTEALPGRRTRVIELLGGRIPPALREQALARACCEVRNLYGSTEVGMVAVGNAELTRRHPGAVGFVVPGAEIEIVDDDGNPLPHGEQGIVRVRTQSMAENYLGSDDLLQRDGWFYPGDLGILADDGMFAVVGRAGDTVNVGGATLAAAPLEAKVRELEGIDEACVLSLPGGDADVITIAIGCSGKTDLKAVLREVTHMFPTGFRIELCRVESMPRNAMGKIVRRDLAAQIAGRRQRSARQA